MRKNKIYILGILLLGTLVFIGIFLFNKKLDNTASLKPDLKVDAISLLADYNINEAEANTKYLDKIIEVIGQVAEIEHENDVLVIYLGEKDNLEYVQCTMLPTEIEKSVPVNVSDEVTIRGYCAGYLLNVIVNRAIFVDESKKN